MYDECQRRGGLFAYSHSGDRNTNAPAECPSVIVGSQENRDDVAQQGGSPLIPRQRPDDIVSSTEGCEPFRQILCHLLHSCGRTRGHCW